MSPDDPMKLHVDPLKTRAAKCLADTQRLMAEVDALALGLPAKSPAEAWASAATNASMTVAASVTAAERIGSVLEQLSPEHPHAADLMGAMANACDAAEGAQRLVGFARERLREAAPKAPPPRMGN